MILLEYTRLSRAFQATYIVLFSSCTLQGQHVGKMNRSWKKRKDIEENSKGSMLYTYIYPFGTVS